jgi:uncharacterized membrane protein YphA (DoxX/SURF4 family)
MIEKRTTRAIGPRVYSLGVMAMAILGLFLGDFINGQPVPKTFPDRTVLAYAAAAFMLVSAAAIQWRRSAAWGAAALTAYYTLVVIILMNGPLWLKQYGVYGIYEDLAEQVAVAAAGLIVYAISAHLDAALAARLKRIGRLAFALCALVWGGAHFVYMNMTAPLVPQWLPPSQVFWGYATGVCFILAGLALLTGIQARLAAVLLTAMLVTFAVLVHTPILIADHKNPFNWSESAINLALIGAAWVVADALAQKKPA